MPLLKVKEVVPITTNEQLERNEEIESSTVTAKADGEINENQGEWYVVHTYSGYENKIKVDLTKRVESMNLQDKIFDIIIPEEQEIEFKGGKKKVVNKKVFPGYIMVNMIMGEDTWVAVRHTPGVTGFVGSGGKPIPLMNEEVTKIFRQMGLIENKPKIIDIAIGENIRVKSGPFENFEGIVRELLPDRGKVRVNISMFGRETPVELDYEQIDKI
jgi:transcriptional antiterminator NusG